MENKIEQAISEALDIILREQRNFQLSDVTDLARKRHPEAMKEYQEQLVEAEMQRMAKEYLATGKIVDEWAESMLPDSKADGTEHHW